MNIKDAEHILRKEIILERTPKGRPIEENAILNLDAALADEKNYGNEVVECISCGFVTSILLVEEGCPNCGVIDLRADLIKE